MPDATTSALFDAYLLNHAIEYELVDTGPGTGSTIVISGDLAPGALNSLINAATVCGYAPWLQDDNLVFVLQGFSATNVPS